MDDNKLYDWLILDKQMSPRAARDVISRGKRVCKMIGECEITEKSLGKLILVESYGDCSMYVKSQLKRTIVLFNEFSSRK